MDLLSKAFSEQASFQSVNEALIQLPERLPLPGEQQDQINDIKQQLSNDVRQTKTPYLVDAIARLVADMRARLQYELNEIEIFLKATITQLQELERQFTVTEELRQASLESRQELHNCVKTKINDIRTSVESAGELKALKEDIQQHIETIHERLNHHHETEMKRDDTYRQHVEEMNRRLADMEQETEQLRTSVVAEHNKATHDFLTGIHNRLAYDERLQQAFTRWKRYSGKLSVIIIDVDNFKRLNDIYGHLSGDKALRSIAAFLKRQVRETDFLARYGGEEFVVMLPDTALDDAFEVADKLCRRIAGTNFQYADKPVQITISCGVSEIHEGDEPENIMQRSDDALYLAKHNGKNCCKSEVDLTTSDAA